MFNTKVLITILLLAILCVELNNGLACYQHDYCIGGCPTLASSVVECASSQSKCWKLSSPAGVKRGCGDNRCMIQIDTGIMGTASVCCTGNLCNSAVPMKTTTMGVIFASFVVFIYAWCV